MKTTKWIIVATLLIAGSTLMAQTTRTNNYADQAFKQTNELVSSMNLSNEQIVDILIINQKYMNLEANNATNSQLTKKEATKAQKKLASAKAKEIKSVLKNKVATAEALAPQSTIPVAFNNASQTIYFGNETQLFNVQ